METTHRHEFWMDMGVPGMAMCECSATRAYNRDTVTYEVREGFAVRMLQELLDKCAREMRRLHDWAERTGADSGSYSFSHKSGEFDHALRIATWATATAAGEGFSLDETELDRALERGDFL